MSPPLPASNVHTLAGRLIAVQEQERARIARELHDDLSQKLALLSIDLKQLIGQTGGSDLLTRRVRSAAEGGLGLVSMRERVRFVGGQMAVQSIPGQGTRIHVSVPVSRDGIELAG